MMLTIGHTMIGGRSAGRWLLVLGHGYSTPGATANHLLSTAVALLGAIAQKARVVTSCHCVSWLGAQRLYVQCLRFGRALPAFEHEIAEVAQDGRVPRVCLRCGAVQ